MATAEKTTVERTVTEDGFILKLTVDEVDTLVAILAKVGGSPTKSSRGKAEDVLNALRSAGARDYYTADGHPITHLSGDLLFNDAPEER